jgi:hypothetical protein
MTRSEIYEIFYLEKENFSYSSKRDYSCCSEEDMHARKQGRAIWIFKALLLKNLRNFYYNLWPSLRKFSEKYTLFKYIVCCLWIIWKDPFHGKPVSYFWMYTKLCLGAILVMGNHVYPRHICGQIHAFITNGHTCSLFLKVDRYVHEVIHTEFLEDLFHLPGGNLPKCFGCN